MNHDQFTYWLQGFVEMNGGEQPTKEQWQMVKNHLRLCFTPVLPMSQLGGGGSSFPQYVYHVKVGPPTGGGGGGEADKYAQYRAGGGGKPQGGGGGC